MHHAAVTAPRLRPVVHAQSVQLPLHPARLSSPARFGTGMGADAGELSATATASSSIIVLPRRVATVSGSGSSSGDQLGAAAGGSASGGLGLGLGLGGGPVPVPLPFSAIAPQLLRGAVGTSASLHFPALAVPQGALGLGLGPDSGSSSGPMLVDEPSPLLRDAGAGAGVGGGAHLSLEHVVGGHEHEMSSPTATLGLACETEIVSSQDEPLAHQHSMAVAAAGSSSSASMTTSGASGANNHHVGRAAAEQHAGYHTPSRASHRGAH